VGDDAETDKFMKMLGDDVFKKLCMRVTLDAQPAPDTAVEKFIEMLMEQPCLFFASKPQITNSAPNQKPMEPKETEEDNTDEAAED